MSLFVNPIQFQNDEKGRSTPFAAYYFYENNTFVFKNTYSDLARTVPNSNPVIADGAGRFPNIYLASDEPYRVRFSELKNPNQYVPVWTEDDVTGGLDATDAVSSIDSVANIAGFTGTADDQQISLKGWHPDSDVGGGTLYWDSAALKSTHNGGTIFSDTVPWTTTTADYLNAVGETDTGGAGVWVRLYTVLEVEMFGANQTIVSDKSAFVKCVTVANGEYVTCSLELLTNENIDLVDVSVNCEFLGNTAGINGAAIPAGTALNEKIILNISGSLGSSSLLTADLPSYAGNIAFSDESVIAVADGSLFAVGDIVFLESDEKFDSAWPSASNKRGETTKVAAVAGNNVTMADPAYFSYATASNAKLTKINTVSVDIKNGVFTGNGVAYAHSGVVITYGYDISIIGSRSEKCEDVGFNLPFCYIANVDVTANECTSSATVGNTGYGVAAINACRHININAELYLCRHAVSGGGEWPALFVKVKGNAVDCGIGTNAWDCHEPCFEWIFDVTSSGGDGGIVCRGSNITISIESDGGAASGVRVRTFGAVTEQTGIHIKKAIITNHKSSAVLLQGIDAPLRDVAIDYFESNNTRLDGVLLSDDTQDVHFGIVKVANTFLNDGESSTSGVGFRIAGTSDSVKNVSVDKLAVSDTIKGSVLLFDCSDIDINYVNAIGAVGNMLEFDTCDRIRVSSGILQPLNVSFSGLFTDTCTNISLHDTEIIGDIANGSQDGWRGVGTNGISMQQCRILVGRHGGFWDTVSDNALLTGNDTRNVVNADKFNTTALTTVVEATNL